MGKLAIWYKLYADELLMDDDLFNLDPAAESLLIRMWALCARDGYCPSDPGLLAAKVRRMQMHVQMHLQSVMHFFVQDENGNLISKRMEHEMSKRKEVADKRRKAAKDRWNKGVSEHDGNLGDANAYAKPHTKTPGYSEVQKKEESTPISPLIPDLELQPEPTPTRKGKRKANPYTQQTIAPENRDAFERAWKQWPEKHPEGGDAHKGSKAQAERNFQAIVDSGECTRRELSVAMTLYAKADTFREEQDPLYPLILDAWSHRASYVKHVASFLGPQDLIYRQFLPLARVALAEADAKRLQPRNDQHQAAS